MSEAVNDELPRRIVAVVTDRAPVALGATTAVADLTAAGTGNVDGPRLPLETMPSMYKQAVERARRFLSQTMSDESIFLVLAESMGEVAVRCAEAAASGAVLALLVIDHPAHRCSPLAPNAVEDDLAKLAAALPRRVEFEPSPATVHVYTESGDTVLSVERFAPRRLPDELWVIAADIVCAFADSVQLHQTRRLRHRPKGNALGTALADFLDLRAGTSWGLHYYTGSVVADAIDHVERRATANGNPVVRGPSEHSLACSALARWSLDSAPFLIMVTSGMVDEFRGTLANLVAARAQGFIVCAESRSSQWYPFQGTVHQSEDSREVMRARGIPTVYLDHVDTLAEGLREAFARYSDEDGPVVIFATREVLQAGGAVEVSPVTGTPVSRLDSVRSDGVDELVRVLNTAPRRLLCQVGWIGENAKDAMYELARRAGIALVDSLTQPGTVSHYRSGRIVPEYLGTMALYGYSARVHDFLYHDGKLRSGTELTPIFLNTRMAQIDTPLSQWALRSLRPIQVNEHPEDLAPLATLGVTGQIEVLLREVLRRLDVDPDVLAVRHAAIESTKNSFSDVIGLVPVQPMTPNYFFRRMNVLLESLIRDHGYRYTGVYDVGRAGLSAVCGLPRTSRGFSGWFGRALMGDALQALPGVIACRNDNVLAFVGDGAAALVPDIVPTLVQQIVVDRLPLRRNLSVFRFANGSHSVIRTYRESFDPSAVGSQTGVLTFVENDWERRVGELTVSHRQLASFDHDLLAARLLRPSTIDLYTVLVGHNNEGDGLSPLSAFGWQRGELSAKYLSLVRGPAKRRESAR